MSDAGLILWWDAQGHLVSWSAEAAAFLEFPASQVVGTDGALLFGSDFAARQELIGRLLQGERLPSPPAAPMGRSGRLVSSHFTALRDATGKLTGLCESLSPRTPEPPVLSDLEDFLDPLEVGAIVVDQQGHIMVCNSNAVHMLGYSRGELLGMDMRALVAQSFPVPSSQSGTSRSKVEVLAKDGHRVPVEIGLSPLRMAEGSYALATLSNIRARRPPSPEEKVFRTLADSLPHLVWACTAGGEVDFVNRTMEEYTGRARGDMLGQGWIEHVHPDDRERVLQAWSEALAAGVEGQVDLRIRRHDGVYRWCDTRARPVRDEKGRVQRWYGSNTDVHEAHMLREALREEQARFQKIAAMAPGALHCYRIRPDGTACFPYISPKSWDIYGLRPDDLVTDAEVIHCRIHPDDREPLTQEVARATASMSNFLYEHRVLHPEKGELWIEIRSIPELEADGSILWTGFLLDVTERTRRDEALTDYQARLLAAMESGHLATFSVDFQTGRVEWDAYLSQLWGRPETERDGRLRTLSAWIHPQDRHDVEEAFLDCARAGRGLDIHFRTLRPDGALQWLTARGRCERDENGKPCRMIAVCVDITERVKEEQIHRRSHKMEALGTLAGGIAHDLNNNLAVILGNLCLLKDEVPADESILESLGEIEKAVERGADLVRRILSFGSTREPEREIVQLEGLLEEAAVSLQSSLADGIQVITRVAENLPPILANAEQMRRIILNLASNAGHAIGSAAGSIEIALDCVQLTAEQARPLPHLGPGPHVRLSVTDSGSGMDWETMERIFDPFFTTKRGPSTGLGLATVHGIVRGHEGAIEVNSEPGRGSTFRVYFPALQAQTEATSRNAAPTILRGQGQRILVVDDEPAVLSINQRSLNSLGYQATPMGDPLAALELFRSDPAHFDGVLTDLAMPHLTGLELARQLRDIRPDIPIALMSGNVTPEDGEAAAALGIQELLFKPTGFNELSAALSRLVGGT